MFVKKNRIRGKPLRRKRTYRKKSTSKVSLATKRYVKSAIHKQIENKRVVIERAITFGSVLGDATLYANALLPYTSLFPLPIGTTQGTRLSNEITIRKLTLRYVLRPTTYQAGVNDNPMPAQILMMIGHYKAQPNALPDSLMVGQLYDSNGTANAPQGDLSDLIAPINKDAWTIKKKWTHKVGNAIYSGPGNLQNFGFFANNDFAYNVTKSINITNLVSRKRVKFNDSQGTIQNIPGLFFMVEALMPNGGIYQASQRPFAIDYWVDLEFEDA